MKKSRKIIYFISIILLIVTLVMLYIVLKNINIREEVKIINKIDDYEYILEDNETMIYKSYFDELILVLEEANVDEENYAKLVVKLFVSDFYNLDNKITKNDVGGVQFIYKAAKDNMILKAKDTIYKYVESNLNGNRKQELPVVSNVEIEDIKQIEFKDEVSKHTDDKAYEIKAIWTYKKDLGYQGSATFKLMHEDKKISIVEIK